MGRPDCRGYRFVTSTPDTRLNHSMAAGQWRNECLFCALPATRVVHEAPLVIAIRDDFPVSPGHTLVIPRRHVASFFELTANESAAIFDLLATARRCLDAEFSPDSFNIGINDGPAAGQTVPHLHVHLIPRYRGDVADPRGGVRWIIPEKAAYWRER